MRKIIQYFLLVTGMISFINIQSFCQTPILILDLDENNNSAPAIVTSLDNLGAEYEIVNSFPPILNTFEAIFVCLGIFSDNHVLSDNEGQLLADYLNSGGSIYMEGGDTWYYDTQTAVHPMFNIIGIADGSGDLSIVLGQAGTFTENMSFSYLGDNSWIDHIDPIAPAIQIFTNPSPQYGTGVAYDAASYKTIGVSYEFGGLADGASPSTKDELMTLYLEFLDVSLAPEAFFYSDDTIICENDVAFFYDQSGGNIISWNWTFEGGSPQSSTQQNPQVDYFDEGSWDVLLEVSDGTETSQLYFDNYINVGSTPGIAPTPTGISFLCASWGNTTYNTNGMSGITEYDWLLEPVEAGSISGGGTNVTVLWEEDFLGQAELSVSGINYCGIGEYSNPLVITRYLPDVTLSLVYSVSISTAPFALTGGSPTGGEYSGTGVSNGMFDPAAAGLGPHEITYTYTDLNLCTNSAVDTIIVTEFTGISDRADKNDVKIFPNPNTGNFTLNINSESSDIVSIKIYNAMNEAVFADNNINISQTYSTEINLDGLAKGIYYLHIEGENTYMVDKILIQ